MVFFAGLRCQHVKWLIKIGPEPEKFVAQVLAVLITVRRYGPAVVVEDQHASCGLKRQG